MMDVDDLKSINDTMGHLQGDELLKRIANVISRCFRGEDVIARIGGDEFAVLLPYTNQNEVVNAVERLKHNIEIKNQLGEKPLLGLSIGFATAENGYELQQAYDLADIGMYKDKALRKKTGPLRDYRI
jgi:diguanylate cyclase (GGDEF)-like protein